jgi:hypothetical protein
VTQGREIRIGFGMHAGDVDEAATAPRYLFNTSISLSLIDHAQALPYFEPNETNYQFL